MQEGGFYPFREELEQLPLTFREKRQFFSFGPTFSHVSLSKSGVSTHTKIICLELTIIGFLTGKVSIFRIVDLVAI